jgi:DNA gyrase subunit B
MDASQLRETTMDPATRTLRRITMGEIDDALAVFDLLMGSDVAPRKEFLVDSAAHLDRNRIDA